MARKRKTTQPISINVAPGGIRRASMDAESQVFDMFLSAHQSGFEGFAAEMILQSVIQSAVHILRTEWYLAFHEGVEEHRERWRAELAEYLEVFSRQFRTAMDALGAGFGDAWDVAVAEHNDCSRQNIEGGAYAYVIPRFNEDGSHEPVGPKDGPYLAREFKGRVPLV